MSPQDVHAVFKDLGIDLEKEEDKQLVRDMVRNQRRCSSVRDYAVQAAVRWGVTGLLVGLTVVFSEQIKDFIVEIVQ